MSSYQETLSDRISKDYIKVEDIVQKNLGIVIHKVDSKESIKRLHQNLYIYKEILNELYLKKLDQEYFYESLSEIMEFLWVILCGKYKLSSMAIRGAMETYAKGLVSALNIAGTGKFANNIELSFKKIIERISVSQKLIIRQKKSFKNIMNTKLADPIKQEYWDLSDIVHSRKTTFNACSEYLDDILEIKSDQNLFNIIMNKANIILEYLIEVLVIANYERLDSDMNFFTFEYIKSKLSEDFQEIQNVFI